MCQQPATEINEITPRSRSKFALSDWRNRVTLCQSCHRAYHDGGVTEAKRQAMIEKRRAFLLMIGRTEYVG